MNRRKKELREKAKCAEVEGSKVGKRSEQMSSRLVFYKVGDEKKPRDETHLPVPMSKRTFFCVKQVVWKEKKGWNRCRRLKDLR